MIVSVFAAPGPVGNAMCAVTDVSPNLVANVSWQPPALSNGVIIGYTISLIMMTPYDRTPNVVFTAPVRDQNFSQLTAQDTLWQVDNTTWMRRAAELGLFGLSDYQIADRHLIFYNITARTSAGDGHTTTVVCSKGKYCMFVYKISISEGLRIQTYCGRYASRRKFIGEIMPDCFF